MRPKSVRRIDDAMMQDNQKQQQQHRM